MLFHILIQINKSLNNRLLTGHGSEAWLNQAGQQVVYLECIARM
jgi:hypothetical protein